MNARISRFTFNWSDEALDRLVEVRAKTVSLGVNDPNNDAERFERAAKAICLVDSQFRRLLRKLIAIAAEHAKSFFSSDEDFVRNLNERDPWRGIRLAAICFTGLSGTGKSKLLEALGKLFPQDQTEDVLGYRGLPMTAAWYLSLEDGTGLNGLLGPVLWPNAVLSPSKSVDGDIPINGPNKGMALPKLMMHARVRTWRDAVCLVFADEFQNISKGEASARATSLLLSLLTLGPRLCFCANFSLVHKLKKWGNPEDKRRLLTNHFELLPDAKRSPAFLRYLKELKEICPDVFIFDVDDCQEFIHDSTFGVKDYVVQLLKWAYVAGCTRGNKGKVELAQIKMAYASKEYSSTRETVEVLWSQAVQSKEIDPRLWSPFRQQGDPFWADEDLKIPDMATQSKVVQATLAIEEYQRRLNDALIEAASQPDQIELTDKPAKPTKPRAKIISLTRGKPGLNDIRHGADLLDSL
jgi:energy-coupling factor transporter ATP-binding protein EcfA2